MMAPRLTEELSAPPSSRQTPSSSSPKEKSVSVPKWERQGAVASLNNKAAGSYH